MAPRETTTRRAYRAGFRAGSIADVGGTPLSAYRYPGLVKAYTQGFTDAQNLKAELPAPVPGSLGDVEVEWYAP